MKRPVVSPERATNDEQEGVQTSLESVIRVMFSSCTAGIVTPSSSSAASKEEMGSPTSSREKSRSTCEPASPTRNVESLYEKLFSDNQLRAEEAVCHLREQLESMRESRSPSRRIVDHSGNDVPCLFPASFPNHKKKEREIVVPTRKSDPSSRHCEITTRKVTNNLSFDDGVSVISQDTLEEMAQVYHGRNGFLERVHSDLTHDPVDAAAESWKLLSNPNKGGSPFRERMGSPPRFTRQPRSIGTIDTKKSRHTLGTKSTKSTVSSQTHDFASTFQKDEAKYWKVVVEEDEQEDPASESIEISSRHDALIRARELRRIREMVSLLYRNPRT